MYWIQENNQKQNDNPGNYNHHFPPLYKLHRLNTLTHRPRCGCRCSNRSVCRPWFICSIERLVVIETSEIVQRAWIQKGVKYSSRIKIDWSGHGFIGNTDLENRIWGRRHLFAFFYSYKIIYFFFPFSRPKYRAYELNLISHPFPPGHPALGLHRVTVPRTLLVPLVDVRCTAGSAWSLDWFHSFGTQQVVDKLSM